MPVSDRLRLDFAHTELGSILGGFFDGDVPVRWAHQQGARLALPSLELSWVSWPARTAHPVNAAAVLPSSLSVSFTGTPDATQRRVLWINGRPHIGEGADGSAMAAEIAASVNDAPEDLGAVATGATLLVSATTPGAIGLWRGGPEVAVLANGLQHFNVKTQSYRAVLGVSASSRTSARGDSAGKIIAQLLDQLTDQPTRDRLRWARIGITSQSAPRDLSLAQGPEFEARTQVDIGIRLSSRHATASDPIETLRITNSSRQPPQTQDLDL